MKPVNCLFCGYQGELVFVHSHYQCPHCGINVAPCCEGEQCQISDENQGVVKEETQDKNEC
jgi:hypothetical protein